MPAEGVDGHNGAGIEGAGQPLEVVDEGVARRVLHHQRDPDRSQVLLKALAARFAQISRLHRPCSLGARQRAGLPPVPDHGPIDLGHELGRRRSQSLLVQAIGLDLLHPLERLGLLDLDSAAAGHVDVDPLPLRPGLGMLAFPVAAPMLAV